MNQRNKFAVPHPFAFSAKGWETTILKGLSSSGRKLKTIHLPFLAARPANLIGRNLQIQRVFHLLLLVMTRSGEKGASITAFPQTIRRIP
jgi:hypothetical protein